MAQHVKPIHGGFTGTLRPIAWCNHSQITEPQMGDRFTGLGFHPTVLGRGRCFDAQQCKVFEICVRFGGVVHRCG